MSDKLNEIVKDIAIKHGVALSKDDPILILQTMNERLLEESRKAQQEMLIQFKEEMENISSEWKDDAQVKAEKTLNTAVSSSKDIMVKLFQESASETLIAMKKVMFDSITEARELTEKTKKISSVALCFSIVFLTGSCLLVLFALYI